MPRSTNARLRAQQSCPVLAKTLMGEVSAARCQSASAKTMLGDLPPSSSETRFRSREASSMMRRPIVVEPVKEIFRIRSEEHTSELQSPYDLVCRLLLEKKK